MAAERVGWKIGLNVPAVMGMLGLDRPVGAELTEATRLENGATVAIGAYNAPLVEPEVAVEVGADGGVARVAAAIELVDIDRPLDDLPAILAGGVFHRGFVFGAFTDSVPDTVEATVTANGEERGRAELDPGLAGALETIAYRAEEAGDELRPGDIVIAGSLTSPVPVAPGDRVTVEVAPLGRLELTFVD
jgi:2-oxo-3-hexenedioate decarboxylase